MIKRYGILSRVVDDYGFVDEEEPLRYYAGRGLWTTDYANIEAFDTKQSAEDFVQIKKSNHVSWNNKIVHEFVIDEKKLFKEKLATEPFRPREIDTVGHRITDT